MKKQDKAALMKIVIGGLVLVGLYFGYQAMTGGSSPFSMAGSGFTGKPGSQADLQTLKLRIIMPSSNRSNMHEDEVAIKATAKFRNHGPQKAYGAEAVFVISENLKFIGNNQPPYNSRGCRPTVGDQQRIVCPLYALKPNLRTKTRYVSVRSNKCDEEGVITVSVQLPPGNTTDLVPDNNTMRKSFKIRGCPVVDDTSSVPTATTTPPVISTPPTATTTPPMVCAPGRVIVTGQAPADDMLSTGDKMVIKAKLETASGTVKVGKIEIEISTLHASLTIDSLKVIKDGIELPLRPHDVSLRPHEVSHRTLHPAKSLEYVNGRFVYEGIPSFMNPIEVTAGNPVTLEFWVNVSETSGGADSLTTKLKHDETPIGLRTSNSRDVIERPEEHSFAWGACNRDSNKEWKNGFYLDGTKVIELPSNAFSLTKN